MKIIIIGSSGYIGSFLYQALSQVPYYSVCGYDIRPSPYTNVILKGREVDVSDSDIVIYLAGLSGRVSCANEIWGNIYNENVSDILEVGRKMTSKQLLIYASTAGILEGSFANPVNEDYVVKTDLLDSYTMSMFEREKAIKLLTNTRTIGLRFGTVIGISPIQRRDLVHIAMIRSAFINGEISVTYPNFSRAILWNKDLERCIKAIVTHWDNVQGHNIYNLASFNTIIIDIANVISQTTNIVLKVVKDDDSMGGFTLDCTKFVNNYNICFKGDNNIITNELKENIGHICIEDQCIEKVCRVCRGSNMTTVIDLGYQPLANNFVQEPTIQNTYPLCVIRCIDCNHTQLNYTVKPEVMFRNYQYNSGTSATLRNYFKELAIECVKESGTVGTVLELACNDGYQLDEFKKLGWKTFGVDPAINLVKRAIDNGHTIHCGFWGKDKVDFLDNVRPDIIIAQNVLAHVPDPVVFLRACADCMTDSTILYIQTSQCNMYINGEFDTIYHEHLSFFTVSSMMKAAELSGLCIVSVAKKPIHGISYLFTMKKISKKENRLTHHESVAKEDYYNEGFFNNYRMRIEGIKAWVTEAINACVNQGFKIIAYGAAAKGMTMLNYFNITNVEYIIDDATMKHYKYTPGTNIQVLPIDTIVNEGNICVIVLAWNFIDEIVANMKKLRLNSTSRTSIMRVWPTQSLINLSDS